MEVFVKSPNLPRGKVKVVIVGQGCPDEIISSLERLGITVLLCPKNPRLDMRLSGHADLSVFHIGGNRFGLAKTLEDSVFAQKLSMLGADLLFSDYEQASAYPKDASLCALSINGRVFHNERRSDKLILSESPHFLNVRQGYSKCAVCPVQENAAISSDKGMIRAMRDSGFDVLEVAPAGVLLNGFSEGFIGGAAFKISAGMMAFSGSLSFHPDSDKILSFIKKHGISPIYLADSELIDVGSFIPILEEAPQCVY